MSAVVDLPALVIYQVPSLLWMARRSSLGSVSPPPGEVLDRIDDLIRLLVMQEATPTPSSSRSSST